MARGFSSGDIYTSMEKLPSVSGVTKSPFTLSVASGDVIPATVTVSLPTGMSPSGNMTSSSSPAVGAIRVGVGTAPGAGNGVTLGTGGGGRVAVGTVMALGATVAAGAGTVLIPGLGVAMGSRVSVGLGDGMADAGAATAGGNVAVGVSVTTGLPQAAAKENSPESSHKAAIPSHLFSKVLTHIPAPQ